MDRTYEELKLFLETLPGLLVAFSGGVDSTLLLAAAHDALGAGVLGVTAVSPTLPHQDLELAESMASTLEVRWLAVETDELDDPTFRANPPNRCYHCKKKIFSRLLEEAERQGLPFVAEGSNIDDLRDFRPGLVALRELAIRSPFIDLGFDKQTIRRLARERGLINWDKPSSACLASRIPYGEVITGKRLERIGQAEEQLRQLGFQQVRVRDYEDLVRIEIEAAELERFLAAQIRRQVVGICKEVGYRYVTIDLEGYRSGSMNTAASSS
jgi:pyridinium-3,5-biscarboxylic acid mononucleotide sulfurtransferase